MYSLIVSAKMNDIDPQAWLADVLCHSADRRIHRLDELLLENGSDNLPSSRHEKRRQCEAARMRQR